jgi:hypothetical protein
MEEDRASFKSHPNDILLSRQALLFGEANSCELLANSAVLILNPNILAAEIGNSFSMIQIQSMRMRISNFH